MAAAIGGRLVGPDVTVDGASIDSRDLAPGSLFVPIVDARDGHDFIPGAVERGAAAVLTSRPAHGLDVTAIEVDDTAAALLALGRWARGRLDSEPAVRAVVGITGSVGKTTTKDLVAATCATTWRTTASPRSFNNELGVPLTLLNAPDGTEVAVVEMGARGRGHIALLCELARPTIGVVTAVEKVHTEMFGSLEEVAVAKGELIEALPADGTAVLDGDKPLVSSMGERTSGRVLRFSVAESPAAGIDLWSTAVELDDELHPSFRLHSPWGETDVRLAVRGRHNVGNALAAAGAALVTGVDLAAVVAGLGTAVVSPWRMALGVAPSGARILNDAYNAGPASTQAAVRALADLGAARPVAVLGVMAELGADGPAAHQAVADLAAELGVRVIAVDAVDYGSDVTHVAGIDEVMADLVAGGLGPDVAVLIKGSRVAGLERLAAALLSGG